MLSASKHERDALIATRRKLTDVLGFLRAMGFSEQQVLNHQVKDGFGGGIPSRDEFGLPLLKDEVVNRGPNPFTDKMKDKMPDSAAHTVFEERSSSPKSSKPLVGIDDKILKENSNVKGDKVAEVSKGETPLKSWATVLKRDCPPPPSFRFLPPGESMIVEPPLEELRKGNDKYKSCVVGSFTKGTKPYKEVAEFAAKMWAVKGLQDVFQKDNRTYVFKFKDEQERDAVLSRGTWYIDKRPMVVTRWGIKPGTDNISAIPMWIKLSNIPDSYWTVEGLSRLASTVGRPLGADPLTAKLDLLPFAKMQVLYKLGDPMPNEVQAVVLDPVSEEKSTVKVQISYPFRPLFCSCCNSLGHTIGACPRVNRVWVKKDQKIEVKTAQPVAAESNPNCPDPPVSNTIVTPIKQSVNECDAAHSERWTEVKRKHGEGSVHSVHSDDSPTPPQVFKNLRNVDEIDKKNPAARLTKSQKKKLKLQKGRDSPSSTH